MAASSVFLQDKEENKLDETLGTAMRHLECSGIHSPDNRQNPNRGPAPVRG